MGNRQVAEQWARAMRDRDAVALTELVHPDIVVSYPQSGEIIRGQDNLLAIASNYPTGLPETDLSELHGTEESVQVTSPLPFGIPTITVAGGGDTFVLEGVAQYPDGGVFHVAMIVQVRDGRIARETSYFAPPFDPPEWRAPFVEP
jgi:ketosteroid isomerase-like protein